MRNPLRQRMIEDLVSAALSEKSRETYLHAVDRLAARTWKAVEELSEKEVRAYLLDLRDNGAAKGTFKTNWHGIKFLFHHTLGRDWGLFGKKRSDSPDRNVSPASSLTRISSAS